MAIVGPEPSVNHFGKMSIFRLFKRLVFIAYNGVFSFYNTVKERFLNYILQKKKLEWWPFLDQNHEVTLWKNVQFSTFSTSFFYRRQAFLCSRILWKTFSLPILPKKKSLEKWPFLDQNDRLIPLEKCQFFDFLNFMFL